MVALKTESATVSAIYAAYEAKFEDYRSHLGASQIGDACDRKLWLSFRWVTKAYFTGRQRRLFETGHREESRMLSNLRSTGATVLDRDPATGRQWLVAEFGGHFGGSLDAMAIGLLEAPSKWHVVECKTHNDKSFKALKKNGVAESKPVHYVQMQIYMHYKHTDRALYFAHNKNDDHLYTERVEFNKTVAKQHVDRAKRIIFDPTAPARISEKDDYYLCKWCDHRDNCHFGAFAEVNCRTCLHSTPQLDGTWHCEHHEKQLSVEEQRAGCNSHLYVPALVGGEPVDADDRSVTYRMRDCSIWVNQAA